MDASSARRTAIMSCQAVQPFDRPRFIMCRMALVIDKLALLISSHVANPSADLRFTSMLRPLRSFSMTAAFSVTMCSQPRNPLDSSRFTTCPIDLRIDAILRLSSSHVARHANQPRESSRFSMCRIALPIAVIPRALSTQEAKAKAS